MRTVPQGPPFVVKNKATDQSVTSSATLVNDNDLLFAIGPNETWVAQFTLYATYAAAGQLIVAITTPAGATQLILANQDANGIVPTFQTTTASGTSLNMTVTAATAGLVYVTVTVVNGATAGNVTLQFAQQTSNATATTLKANSNMVAWKQ